MSRIITPDQPYSEEYGRDFWSGYVKEQEDVQNLVATAVDYDWGSLVCGDDTPQKFSIADWWPVEFQGPIGSCAGQAASGAAEIEHYKLTGTPIAFNANFTYIEGQRYNKGLFGRDNGATIDGVVRSTKEKGCAPMDWDKDGQVDYPYPARYTTAIPQQAYTYAGQYKIQFHAVLKNWDEINKFLKTNGTVVVGGDWGNWGPDSSGLCSNFRSGGGGHAWIICGWDETNTRFREPVLECVNSHGKRWGKNGFHFLNRRFVDQFLSARWTVVIGISRLTVPGPTKYSFEQWKKAVPFQFMPQWRV